MNHGQRATATRGAYDLAVMFMIAATNVVICRAPVVEGAVMAAAEASGGSSLQKVRATAEEYFR